MLLYETIKRQTSTCRFVHNQECVDELVIWIFPAVKSYLFKFDGWKFWKVPSVSRIDHTPVVMTKLLLLHTNSAKAIKNGHAPSDRKFQRPLS